MSTPPSPRRWGSVFDKLNDPALFTGVYAERFRSGPEMNAKSGHLLSSPRRTAISGNTNSGTDETVRDLQHITRDYLNRDTSGPASPLQRAASRNRIRLGHAERSLYRDDEEGEVSRSPADSQWDTRRDVEVAEDAGELVDVPLDTNTQLQLIFQYYCRFGRTGSHGDEQDTMDSFNFSRFTKECPDLIDRILSSTEIDLIFVKCKAKTQRRLTYGQFLDALAAMAVVKYDDVEDSAEAFSVLLANHVFQCPASLGIAAALRSGMLQLEPMSKAQSKSGGSSARGEDDSAPRSNYSSPAATPAVAMRAAPPPKHSTPGGVSSSASTSTSASVSHGGGVPTSAVPPFTHPGPYAWPFPSAPTPATVPASGSESASGGGGGETGYQIPPGYPMPGSHPGMPYPYMYYYYPPPPGYPTAPPGYPAAPPPGYPGAPQSYMGYPGGPPPSGSYPMPPPGYSSNPYPPHGGYAPPATAPAAASHTPGRSYGYETPESPRSSRRGGARGRSPARTPGSPRSYVSHEASASGIISLLSPSTSIPAVSGAARARSARRGTPRSVSPSKLGTVDFKPTLAGEGNRAGGVYERLASPASFTGVYRRAWITDGRINHFTETGVSNLPTKFVGDTNTGTDETIHDISHMLRPNLRVGKSMK